jgi:hypothetical protein
MSIDSTRRRTGAGAIIGDAAAARRPRPACREGMVA